MADTSESNGEDLMAICLEELRRCYFEVGGWSELEGVIHDTVEEFGPSVSVDVSDFPGWERLDDSEREQLASYMTGFARRVRAPMLMALIVARLQVCAQQRAPERRQGH